MGASYRPGMSGSSSRGPEMYFGYCRRSRQYRMMDLPDYLDNTQAGMSQMMTDSASAMQRMWSPGSGGGTATEGRHQHHHGHKHGGCGCEDDCGCGGRHGCQCHCECCVNDADVLIHARCGELRRIPLTFENESRRDKPVTLVLEKFVSSGGRDLGWQAALTETQFTLHPCDEHTVSLAVRIRCDTGKPDPVPAPPTTDGNPNGNPNAPGGIAGAPPSAGGIAITVNRGDDAFGSVDKCEVGYATIRAEGCQTRPIVVAIAVLPDDCDASRHGCGCGCCGD